MLAIKRAYHQHLQTEETILTPAISVLLDRQNHTLASPPARSNIVFVMSIFYKNGFLAKPTMPINLLRVYHTRIQDP